MRRVISESIPLWKAQAEDFRHVYLRRERVLFLLRDSCMAQAKHFLLWKDLKVSDETWVTRGRMNVSLPFLHDRRHYSIIAVNKGFGLRVGIWHGVIVWLQIFYSFIFCVREAWVRLTDLKSDFRRGTFNRLCRNKEWWWCNIKYLSRTLQWNYSVTR